MGKDRRLVRLDPPPQEATGDLVDQMTEEDPQTKKNTPNKNLGYLARMMAAIAMVVVIGFATHHTKNPVCLWALFFPLWVMEPVKF